MFWRVVRFWGRGGDGKRLDNPPAPIAPLQTAYVYGLRADYHEQIPGKLTRGAIHKMTGGMEDVNRIARPCRELLRRCAA